MNVLHPLLVCFFYIIIATASGQTQEYADDKEFTKISNVPQDVKKVYLPVHCPKWGHRTRAMVTIEPTTDGTDQVQVSTYPANLVTASTGDDSTLKLTWNEDVAFDSNVKEGGIRIFFPADQLKSVSVTADSEAQILNGFTSIEYIKVSSDAKLQADLLSLTKNNQNDIDGDDNDDDDDPKFEVFVKSDAQATVLSSIAISKLDVSSDAHASIGANVHGLSVKSDA